MSELIKYISKVVNENMPPDCFEAARVKKFDKKIECDLCDSFSKAFSKKGFRFGFSSVFAFNGVYYEKINKSQIEYVVSEIMERNSLSSIAFVGSCPSISNHVVRKLVAKEFEPSRTIVSFENGIMDIDTLKFHRHDEKFETMVRLPFAYDPTAKCPLFDKFLSEVLPEQDVRNALQDAFGYIFCDRKKIKFEKIVMLCGTGSNGKSVLYEAINSVLGAENVSNFSLYDLVDHPQADYKLASCNGKLINYCSDMGNKDTSGGRYKTIISGEDIECRFPNEKPHKATMIPPMFANVNEIPATSDPTLGHHRRQFIIPFEKTISEKDADLELSHKLRAEIPGIFNWIIEGTKRIRANSGKITESESIKKSIAKARIESNSVLMFLEEINWTPNDNGKLVSHIIQKALYEKYTEYCRSNGFKPFGTKQLKKILEAEGYKVTRVAEGMRIYYYEKDLEPVIDEKEEEEDNLPF